MSTTESYFGKSAQLLRKLRCVLSSDKSTSGRKIYSCCICFLIPAQGKSATTQTGTRLINLIQELRPDRSQVAAWFSCPGHFGCGSNGQSATVQRFPGWYQFDTKTIRFIYEPELGNNLVLDHLKPWIVFLTKNCFRGNIFFAPVISDVTHLSHEITSLQSMIAEL